MVVSDLAPKTVHTMEEGRMRIAREYPVFASTGFQGGSVKGRLAGKVLVGASWIDSSPCMFFVPDID